MSTIHIDPGSVVTTRLQMFYRESPLSVGTGFFYEYKGRVFLVTNWHNVSVRDPQTGSLLSSCGGIPDRLRLTVLQSGRLDQWREVDMLLYNDANDEMQPQSPIWMVHPRHCQRVDVVAIPFVTPAWGGIRTVNTIDSTPTMRVSVSGDVFVLGYPRGISGGGEYPIWKRASIASEPEIDLDGLPKFLIDTATREGMSGAPVFAKNVGGFRAQDGSMQMGQDGSRFVGVYSGRLGSDEFKAQLGIVWKVSALDEIILGGVVGSSSFNV